MYFEQAVAVDTVRFWHQLALQIDVDEVVFATTAKEELRDESSTHELIESVLAGLREQPARLRLLKCRDVTRFRAAQLNMAVEHARQHFVTTGTDKTKIWIGVYNADSRPHASTFVELKDLLSVEPNTRMYQQLVDYVVPQRPGTGLVAVGNSILQTWWTRSHYWARSTRGRRGHSSWAATAPYSTFGHGEFVRLDFLDEIGGFPNFAYADGLLLGWICRLKDEPIGLLASRDCAEVPRTARDLVTQQTAWLRGLLNFDATVRWCRAHGQLRLSRREVAVLQAQHLTIPVAWGLSSAAVVAGFVAVARRVGRGDSTAVDLVRLGVLVSYPLIPAVPGIGVHLREHRLTTRLLGAAASWTIEGLAFWPAFFGHLRRAQDAPAKTPR
ncbi:MAG: hypothetical protein ACRDTA_24205 [Pseudonocardiaceae bacterium]